MLIKQLSLFSLKKYAKVRKTVLNARKSEHSIKYNVLSNKAMTRAAYFFPSKQFSHTTVLSSVQEIRASICKDKSYQAHYFFFSIPGKKQIH